MTKKEIKKERKELLSFFSKLKFNEEKHEYSVDGKVLPSVSSLLKNFYDEFEKDKVSYNYALKHSFNQNDVLSAWDGENKKSTTEGSRVHLFGEDFATAKYFANTVTPLPMSKQDLGIIQWWIDCCDSVHYIIPLVLELQMYNLDLGYAGTADIILLDTRDNSLIIADYKGLDITTPIFTTKGWKTMKTIQKGDFVYDKKGKVCEVIGTSEVKNIDCYKIVFDNGDEIISDFEHRWEVSYFNRGVKTNRIKTTVELFKDLKNNPKKYAYKIPKIINPSPLNNEDISLPIDPYLLGVWLGDGHKVDTKITQANKKVWNEIEKRGYKVGKDVSQGGAGNAQTKTILGIRNIFSKLNLLNNKHIPDIYFMSSFNQRINLLKGLMDSDGYYNKSRKRYVISTTKKEQVDFSIKLLGSLGIKATIIECNKYCNNKIIKGFDICFTTNLNVFLCRNQDINLKTNNEHTYRRIVDIKKIDSVPTRCIEVDSDTHTFLVGKSFIPTHNTNKELFNNFNNKKLKLIGQNLLEDNFNKYQLQLSFYQVLLESIGYKVKARILVWLNEKDGKLYQNFYCKDYTKELRQFLSK